MIVTRIIKYNGDPEWVEATIEKALPLGKTIIETKGTITIYQCKEKRTNYEQRSNNE